MFPTKDTKSTKNLVFFVSLWEIQNSIVLTNFAEVLIGNFRLFLPVKNFSTELIFTFNKR